MKSVTLFALTATIAIATLVMLTSIPSSEMQLDDLTDPDFELEYGAFI